MVHENTRLVGVVCELATVERAWRPEGLNQTVVKIELAGEIVEEEPGKPRILPRIRTFPKLGAIGAPHPRRTICAPSTRSAARRASRSAASRRTSTVPATVSIGELIDAATSRSAARPASGRSTAVAMLIKQCIRNLPELRVLIVDPHNEYARHFPTEAACLTPIPSNCRTGCSGSTRSSTSFRRPQGQPGGKRRALRDHSHRQTRFSAGAGGRLSESSLRRQSAQETSWVSADTPVPYRVSDAVQIIDEWMGKLDPRYARADLRAIRTGSTR